MAAHGAYYRWSFRVPVALEEVVVAELAAAGTLGVHVREAGEGRRRLDAYFSRPPRSSSEVGRWPGVERLAVERLADRDWLAAYRAAAVPLRLGRGFVVDPRDLDAAVEERGSCAGGAAAGRQLLRIPARTAFGTGSHESTRLAVALLEEVAVAGREVLDVGTGSGILAFVAARLGARRVVALDRDPEAVAVARHNAAVNRCRPVLVAGRLAALAPLPLFDLAVVNVLPQHIVPELPRLVATLKPGAALISSGNLWEERSAVRAALRESGVAVVGSRRLGEWVALLAEKRPARPVKPRRAGG